MLDSRVTCLGERFLPDFLLRRLDPFRALIDEEVAAAAGRLGEDQVVLDAGAGEARHRSCFTRGTYVALDAGTGDEAWNYSRLDIRGDLENIPLRSVSVDSIICMVVLEHTRDPRRVLTEFARVLREGGSLYLVVPFLWEEHQAPNDYFRFTRYGIRLLFEGIPLRIEGLRPAGGFFGVCARRCFNALAFFQGGPRWILFALLAPLLGFALPLLLHALDGLDRSRHFTLGFLVRATKDSVDAR